MSKGKSNAKDAAAPTPLGGGPRTPAVFLDRDNTLIHNDGDLGEPDGVELVQGAAMAVASLRGLGFKVIGITNQGGVARGKYEESDVEAVHERIDALLERGANGADVAGWYFCPFHPRGTVEKYTREHPDRKPAPGMLLRAAEEHRIDLGKSWMVGDSLRDTQAGEAAGCRTVLLHPEAGRLSPTRLAEVAKQQAAEAAGDEPDPEAEAAALAHKPDFFAGTLVEAVRVIASQRHTERGRTATRSATPSRPSPRREASPAPASTRGPAKAFRPLSLPPEEESGPLAEPELDVGSAIERAVKRARGITEGAAEPKAAPAPEAAPAPAPPPAPPPESADRVPETSKSATVRGSQPEDESGSTRLLGQILHELRATRGTGGDASAVTIVAGVLQALAAVCLLGALWMAAGDDALFQRWALATVFFQLTTLAALLMQRR